MSSFRGVSNEVNAISNQQGQNSPVVYNSQIIGHLQNQHPQGSSVVQNDTLVGKALQTVRTQQLF